MASVVNDSNGRKRISYQAQGKRHTLRLGAVAADVAADYAGKIGRIIACAGAPHLLSIDVIRWAADLPDKTYGQLAAAGLVPRRGTRDAVTLGRFLEEVFSSLHVKPSTAVAYGHTRRCLLQFFGAEMDLPAIGPREADGFHAWLGTHDFAERKAADQKAGATPRKLSPATISRRILCARHLFHKAKRWHGIENAFAGLKCGQQRNESRKFFVPRETIAAALDECPDNQWRLILILSRYGGLRCPSEHLALKWSDVHWDKGSMTVHSPKTEHHAGGDVRTIPLFPELRDALQAAFDDLEEGAPDWIIARYRSASCNLRSQFLRILRRAAVKPWPRLFQNLRASRETELFQQYPLETACAWIGNSPQVAVIHYLNNPSKDDHFQRALSPEAPAEVTRIPTRNMGKNEEKPVNAEVGEVAKSPEITQEGGFSAAPGWAIQDSNHPQNLRDFGGRCKFDAQSDALTPELAEIMAAWSELPAGVRAGIVAMVRAMRTAGGVGVAGRGRRGDE